ncbi:MAG: hypothetical protein IPJ65_01920 [Archangiaceae bacterium]|nr:hypothetical protein [Archangiaceae bacterium]
MKADVAQQLEAELVARGFRREGHGLEAPGGTVGLADAYLRRAELSELLEAAVVKRNASAGTELADFGALVEALKAAINRYC